MSVVAHRNFLKRFRGGPGPGPSVNSNTPSIESVIQSNPAEELFSRNKYATIPPEQIFHALDLYDTETDICDAASINLTGLLSGGVFYKRKFHTLDSHYVQIMNEKSVRFSKSMWRYLFSISFAACIIDPEAGDKDPFPFLVLPLEYLEVHYYCDSFGRMAFRYYRSLTPEEQSEIQGSEMKQEIKNVHTFLWKPNFFDRYGNLKSTVLSLCPELELFRVKKDVTIQADIMRANPSIITEVVPEKRDTDMPPLLPSTATYPGDGNNPHPQNETYQSARIPYGSKNAPMPHNRETMMQMFKATTNTQMNDTYNSKVDIVIGRKLAHASNVEAPQDLLNVKVAKKEDIYQAFCIPMTMLSNASSSSNMRSATSGSSSGGGKSSSGNNASARALFQAHLGAMKTFTVNMLKSMVQAYYTRSAYEECRSEYNKECKDIPVAKRPAFNFDKVAATVEVDVIIPGQPDDSVLNDLFVMGALKYEYFKEAMSNRYCIPIDAFNDKMELTIEQMNGVQEKEPAAAQPGATKKKAKTTK